jgi:hypothetical protein
MTTTLNPPKSDSRLKKWQNILDHYLKDCITFFYPTIHEKINWSKGCRILDAQLQSIKFDDMVKKPFIGKLLTFTWKSGESGAILLHVTGGEDGLPAYLLRYHSQIYHLYDLLALPLVILTDDHPDWHPKHYEFSTGGYSTLNLSLQTCKLLDYQDKKDVLKQEESLFGMMVLAYLAVMETKENPQARYSSKLELTRLSLTKEYSRNTRADVIQMINWAIRLPEELELEYLAELCELMLDKKECINGLKKFIRDEGYLEIYQEEYQKGYEEGKRNKKMAIARSMLDRNISLDWVKQIMRLSDSDLADLEKQVKQH